jgi:dipeptidyl aminopeptidase/acylaminoacyl peptidase
VQGHGDQDFISIAQAEEMFSALRRVGKAAEFVRYWGEGHILSSPANIKDAWQRIFRWLYDLSPLR